MTKKVLVVDDEEGVLFTLAANLELEGFEVVSASSGREALEVLAKGRVDLVLSDVRMPSMTGVELFRNIRAIDPEVPVVLMTGFAHESQVESAMRDGAFAVLPKPLPFDRLMVLLSRAIARPLVLVVDDVEAVASSTADALASVGLRARAVHDGVEAVKCVATEEIDVCVVDLVMPGIDGAETVRRILEADRRMRCIVVSGENTPVLVRRVAAMSFAILRKPVEPRELAMTIARARSSTVLHAPGG